MSQASSFRSGTKHVKHTLFENGTHSQIGSHTVKMSDKWLRLIRDFVSFMTRIQGASLIIWVRRRKKFTSTSKGLFWRAKKRPERQKINRIVWKKDDDVRLSSSICSSKGMDKRTDHCAGDGIRSVETSEGERLSLNYTIRASLFS